MLVSSSYVPSSQKSVVADQPLKGLVPEELCLSSSEASQLRGSSEESYSILQGRSSPGGKAPDVSIVPSSQNSHEYEMEQPLPHIITPQRTQLHCSLTESQLGNLLETSVSFDEVTSPPCFSDVPSPTQEGFTQIKPRNACQSESISNKHSRHTVVTQLSLSSTHNLPEKESPLENQRKDRTTFVEKVSKNADKEGTVSSSARDIISHTSKGKEDTEKAKVDFDALFCQNTWKHSQRPALEFSADLLEIDRRQSTKRKRTEEDDSVHQTRSSACVRRGNKLLLPDSPVSPGESEHSSKKMLNQQRCKQTKQPRTTTRAKKCRFLLAVSEIKKIKLFLSFPKFMDFVF